MPPHDRRPAAAPLALRQVGAGEALVLVHGFTLNAAAWGPVLDALATHRHVVAVDLPGHGDSASVAVDLPGAADMVGAVGGRADYLGYSLGGRVCLQLALARPDLVRRLVVVGASAGIADAGERLGRRRADARLAEDLERAALALGERRALVQFVERWLSGPLFESLAPDRAQIGARCRNTTAGLAASLRLCGTGAMVPLWERLPELDMEVLVIAGDADGRFTDIGRRMVEAIGPNASLALVRGAGHACHLERPETTAAIVGSFLAGTA